MLYKKNNSKTLDMELFKNPTSEYRGTPFWAWNTKLEKDVLLEQIDFLKEMGFGGFHMHSRSGLATAYLSDEFMDLVKACVEKAKKEDMLAWLYDEDRYSSGYAGGYLTKTKKYRTKYLMFTTKKDDNAIEKEKAIEEGKPYLLACFDVVLDNNGELAEYSLIDEATKPKDTKWYAYVKTGGDSRWFNNQSYVDTLSKEAIDKFIKITHKRYKDYIGEDFGTVVPAIFTDEPSFARKQRLPFAKSQHYATMPWTTFFQDEFKKAYNFDIVEKLPEIFWNLQQNKPSNARYKFHDFVTEIYVRSFLDNCAAWCKSNGIALTGHVFEEPTLRSQSAGVGETMRAYRSMELPGIDMLCDWMELTTAKQAQSVVHQYGREGMTSELYGVTNWDFDFRGHKFQGDWQAALGVTIRVPHLSWVSMKGASKRDYPASFNYQAPWYKDYSYVEDHYARLNTVMTRGKPNVNVGVIHPIESCWISYGPIDTSEDELNDMQDNFQNITEWLLFGLVEFDYISESLLEEKSNGATDKLNMGEMNYSSVIVSACKSLRRNTFELLKKFRENGGNLVFCGDCPQYIDAVETDEVRSLYEKSVVVSMNRNAVLKAVDCDRFLEVRNNKTGDRTNNIIHSMRDDNGIAWIFMAHAKKHTTGDIVDCENLKITVKGEFIPEIFDTIKGTTRTPIYEYENGNTVIFEDVYIYDSLLIRLENGKKEPPKIEPKEEKVKKTIDIKDFVDYSLEEQNVCVLDIAQHKIDDGEFMPEEEILRLDEKYRLQYDYPLATGEDTQPWIFGEEKIEHYVTLKFEIESEIETKGAYFAAEEAEYLELNSKPVELLQCGYYVDRCIKKYKLPIIEKGINTLIVKVPFGKYVGPENCFILGDFGVEVHGAKKKIVKMPEKITFGALSTQGFPFYGGNITYSFDFDVEEDSALEVFAGHYRGAMLKVSLDGERFGEIVYPPYVCKKDKISKGRHQFAITMVGSRINTFGPIHDYSLDYWNGPQRWFVRDRRGFKYEYVLKDTGVLASPVLVLK